MRVAGAAQGWQQRRLELGDCLKVLQRRSQEEKASALKETRARTC